MEPEALPCLEFLEAIAALNERFGAFERHLRTIASVSGSRGEIDICIYESGVALERYVEADVRDGRNICWWLDMTRGDGTWVIQSRVYESHGDNIRVFDDRLADSLDNLIRQMDEAATDLIRTVAEDVIPGRNYF